jgi:putative acetyltransferase
MLGPVTVSPAPLSSADAAVLIARLDAELAERYPDLEHNHFGLTPAQVRAGQGVFLIARAASQPVGCGALRRVHRTTGEIKRMYVLPYARGTRVGRRLLSELERHALQYGLRRLVVGTGARQPEAIRLYERSGFTPIPCFAEHADSYARICMAKVLIPRSNDGDGGTEPGIA